MKPFELFIIALFIALEIYIIINCINSKHPVEISFYNFVLAIFFPLIIDFSTIHLNRNDPFRLTRSYFSAFSYGPRKNKKSEYYLGIFFIGNIIFTLIFALIMYLIYG